MFQTTNQLWDGRSNRMFTSTKKKMPIGLCFQDASRRRKLPTNDASDNFRAEPMVDSVRFPDGFVQKWWQIFEP